MIGPSVDGVLVTWGERLFYPSNRIVRSPPTPRLDTLLRRKATVIRRRIEATVRRAPQVMVKVTGGGRGMGAIAAHFRYISKSGRLAIEDDRGVTRTGKDALHDLVDQWRYGGSFIDEVSPRREAFNLTLSMPAGANAGLLKMAVREFAQAELAGHRYVMVLHEHQANPHVHLSVRAESATGKRLNPRKTDLHRWRETFAEKLRGWGIEAEATRQASRGELRRYEPLWRIKAREEGRLRQTEVPSERGRKSLDSRTEAARSWAHITQALAASDAPDDRKLAQRVARFLRETPLVRQHAREIMPGARSAASPLRPTLMVAVERVRAEPDIRR
ncbi:conjugal transfer protein TraS [Pelomonas sp. KK5]|uniref:relaxase/mobilization nuclease domain-containing protein n=1 Tax=Pelomonas sp. KK5 TaxID=1855730 RepID=UPI00097BEC0E|nr:conjugal transfer protein TraS [Pelomonas sp. KK5]